MPNIHTTSVGMFTNCTTTACYLLFRQGPWLVFIFMKTISLLTSTFVLSQRSAKEDLELVAVSSSSFKQPLTFSSLFMLPEWFPSIALGKSLRKADLYATTKNSLG